MTNMNNFNVGDIVKEYNAYGECYGFRKVVRITKTGRIRLDNGGFYKADGTSVATTPGYGNGWTVKVEQENEK